MFFNNKFDNKLCLRVRVKVIVEISDQELQLTEKEKIAEILTKQHKEVQTNIIKKL